MDENYEWDSEFPGDLELLDTLHLGLAGPQARPEAEPELGVCTQSHTVPGLPCLQAALSQLPESAGSASSHPQISHMAPLL